MEIKEIKERVGVGAKAVFNDLEKKTKSTQIKLKVKKLKKDIIDKYYLIGKYIYESGLPIDKKDKEVIDMFEYINDAYLKIDKYEKILKTENRVKKNDKRNNN